VSIRDGRDVYVALIDGQSVKQWTFHDQIVFDLDADNNIIGVEILGARSVAVDGKELATEWAVRQHRLITPFEDEERARAMVIAMRHPLPAEVVSREISEWRAAPEVSE
jgi:uncharacterized protein YuzE